MAQTVDSAFNEFNRDSVNLNPDRTTKAISSRDWLWGQLNTLDSKEDLDFPFKYQDKHIKFGSFARKTKIRELDDIDIMFCLTANGATYLQSGSVYYIHTPNAGDRLKKLSDNDVLNSRKVVNKVKNSLSKIEHYKSAELHSRGEAATLSLQSYEWVFDIVPCFYTDVNDPKGIQGNLNNLSFEQKKSISEKANWAYEKAKEAISAETSEKNQEKAINKWREIFGTKFPTYG